MRQDSLFSARPEPPEQQIRGVSSVVEYIKRVLESNKPLAGTRVRGEVSEMTEKNGHRYFCLKEGNDILKCIVWASTAARIGPFENGEEVVCGGDFTAYRARSVYQLIVRSVERTGTGMLYAQFVALKERFAAEGLFKSDRKRALPKLPRRVAVVSARGKGAEDFLRTAAREAPFLEIEFVETRVQGDGAEIDIADALDRASKLAVDVIVLTRGGGSYEDLFPFNREPVVRAVLRSRRPVLSAIGHAEDHHLSDLVADYVCETPSNAAQYFAQIGNSIRADIHEAQVRIDRAAWSLVTNALQNFERTSSRFREGLRRPVRAAELRLTALERRLAAQAPQQRLALRGQRLVELRTRLAAAERLACSPGRDRVRRTLQSLVAAAASVHDTARQRLTLLHTRLVAADPRAPLRRGYAIVSYDGGAVRESASVPKGALIHARLERGTLIARVEESRHDE